MTPTSPGEPSGSWDSIHVFETAERGRQAHYKLTSTIMLQLVTRRGGEGDGDGENHGPNLTFGEKKPANEGWKREGEVSLSGSMTRQVRCPLRVRLIRALVNETANMQTEQDCPLQDPSSHVTNTGKMIEEMEIKMRNLLQEVRRSVTSRCILISHIFLLPRQGVLW